MLLLAACAAPTNGPRLVVLGIAQDGGIPHLGCTKPPCSDGRREKVSCLGLTDGTRTYLFDATPDMPAQLRALNGGRAPDGIFLTHAHIGHYTGLMYLGKETLAARGVPVYGTRRMAEFLTNNGPWSLLVKDGHIDVRDNAAVELPGGFRVTAIPVPHREEFTDTVGYLIEGPRRKALFIPDIDKWEKWDRDIREFDVDYAFLDGTFSSAGEIPRVSDVPHPLMDDTRARLRGSRTKLWFIHLNHTNPALLDGDDVAREGMEFEM
jgi:pyrroloquinoline quinone biosynthesis protein B